MKYSPRPDPQPCRRLRRGSQAVEFALTLPVLTVMLLGLVDYGWFFLQQSLVANAMREAMRYGAIQKPATGDAAGTCTPCRTSTATEAVVLLGNYGITVHPADVTPTIVKVGTTCALSLTPTVPYTPMAGLVPVPASFDIDSIAFLQNVTGC